VKASSRKTARFYGANAARTIEVFDETRWETSGEQGARSQTRKFLRIFASGVDPRGYLRGLTGM